MLDVKYSNVLSYVLLYDDEKVYLVDTKYTDSLFNLSKPPEKVTLKAYLLEQRLVSNFEVSKSKGIGTINAVLITQPVSTLIYNLGKYIFQEFEENYYVLTKLFLLLVVLAITMLASRIYLKSLKKKIPSHLMQQDQTFYLKIYKPEESIKKSFRGQLENIFRNMLGYILGLAIVGVPLYLYFKIDSGIESALLMVISFIFFILYMPTKMSPIAGPVYRKYNFIIKKNTN